MLILLQLISQYRYDGETFKDEFWNDPTYSIFLTKSITLDTTVNELKAKIYGNGLVITCTEICFNSISQDAAIINVSFIFVNQDGSNTIAKTITGGYLYQVGIQGNGLVATTITLSSLNYWSGGVICDAISLSNITNSDLSATMVKTANKINIVNSRLIYPTEVNLFCTDVSQCIINIIYNSFIHSLIPVTKSIFTSVATVQNSNILVKEMSVSILGSVQSYLNSTFQIMTLTGSNQGVLSTSIQQVLINNSYILIETMTASEGFSLLTAGLNLQSSVLNISNINQAVLFQTLSQLTLNNSLILIDKFQLTGSSSLFAVSSNNCNLLNSVITIQNGQILGDQDQLTLFIPLIQSMAITQFTFNLNNLTQTGNIKQLSVFSQQLQGTYNNWFVNLHNISFQEATVTIISNSQAFLTNAQNLTMNIQNMTFSKQGQQIFILGQGSYNFASITFNATNQKMPLKMSLFSDNSNLIGGPNLFLNVIQPIIPVIIFAFKETLCPNCVNLCFIRGVTTTSQQCTSYNNQPLAWYNTQSFEPILKIEPILNFTLTNKVFYIYSFTDQLQFQCATPNCDNMGINQLNCQNFACSYDFCDCIQCTPNLICQKSENREKQGTIQLANFTFCDLQYELKAKQCVVNCQILTVTESNCNNVGTQNSVCQQNSITERFGCICPSNIDFLTSPDLTCQEGCQNINSTQGICSGIQQSICKLNYFNSNDQYLCDLNFCDFSPIGAACSYPGSQFKPSQTLNYQCYNIIPDHSRCYSPQVFTYCSTCEQFKSGKCQVVNYNEQTINQTLSQNIVMAQLSCNCIRTGYTGQFCQNYNCNDAGNLKCESHGICLQSGKCQCDKYTFQESTGNCILGCSNQIIFYGQCVGQNLLNCYGVKSIILGAKPGANCADCRQARLLNVDQCGKNGVCSDFTGLCVCNQGHFLYKTGFCEPPRKCGSGKFVYDPIMFEFSCDCGGLNNVNSDGSCRVFVGAVATISVIFSLLAIGIAVFLIVFFVRRARNSKVKASRMTVTGKSVARYFVE
ncbi:Cysteine-rich membrane protein 2 [Spironucleus salmonicida]|uniref:Cysteine-rich membrane protein 2 n=1 Tax=Spironucleus salmonicida TaxID=348837 RepID=V6LHC0_9EUKA|nr:Cysteine-rich membrane protein 2 [Spironucleus salmonicida]|eukprot:EST43960.1 Cysteine-rich membrane protein 2 [Spironucleus salmonicida]